MGAMDPWCKSYMEHRAELYALAGHHCAAAQGRINAADMDDTHGPMGCLQTAPSGTKGQSGTPRTLLSQKCTFAERELLCMRRLKQLTRGAPAPGETMKAGAMDKMVREWCHPMYVLNINHMSKDLVSGMP